MDTPHTENQDAQPDQTLQKQESTQLQEKDDSTGVIASLNPEYEESKQKEQQNNLEQPTVTQTQADNPNTVPEFSSDKNESLTRTDPPRAENQGVEHDGTHQEQNSTKLNKENDNTDSVVSVNTEHEEIKQKEQQNNLEQPLTTQTDYPETDPEFSSESEEKSKDKISLLLVGRSGHGKSSTGNSILGEKVFQLKSNVTEENKSNDMIPATRKINAREVQVVDATGLADNDQEFPENAGHFINLANKAMDLVPQTGYSAIVLVLKYGISFTKQEKEALQMIKSLFGPEIIQRHGIIVMTCGDQFERDMEDESLSFQQWCEQQEGEVKRLMEECGQRCVLFDNKTKDPDRQREQLIFHVDEIRNRPGPGPYKKIDFEAAEPRRAKLRVMAKVPHLEQKVDSFLQDIKKDLDGLQSKLERLQKDLLEEDEGTGSITVLITRLKCIKQNFVMLKSSLGTPPTGLSQPNCPAPDREIAVKPRRLWDRASNFIRDKWNGR